MLLQARPYRNRESNRNETVVLTVLYLLNLMDYIFIDKHSLTSGSHSRTVQCYQFDCPMFDVYELQILMPVHHLKSGISWIAMLIYNIQNQIGKIRVRIEID